MLNKTIDDIILQYSSRGMDKIQEEFNVQHCKNACNEFVKIEKGNVFIYTGFYVKGYAETDGPLGAYFLAKSLNTLGYTAIIITDEFCKNFFPNIKTLYLTHKDCKKEESLLNILKEYSPVCHFSIERCGRNINNDYMNSRKISIAEFTPAVDLLFSLGNKTRKSFAIGDGGNEIGMGNFKDFIKESLKQEPCIVECDFPIIASVSNWGAYGFIAYLEKTLKINLLPSIKDLESYLEYIVSLGAVDGITGKNEATVDGKEWELENIILNDLTQNIKNNL